MKKLLQIAVAVLFTGQTFCQSADSSQSVPKQDYLTKSRHQKTAAFFLLGGGLIATIAGFNNFASHPLENRSPGLFFVGLGSMIGSIPLFISAAKNKGRGMSMSLIREKVPAIRNGSFVNQSYPALRIKINLR